jgi:hypothetical protein
MMGGEIGKAYIQRYVSWFRRDSGQDDACCTELHQAANFAATAMSWSMLMNCTQFSSSCGVG